MVLLQRKLYFPKDPEVVQHFPGWGGGGGGVQLFPGGGGPNANFYRNPYNLCVPGGGLDPLHPPSGSPHGYVHIQIITRYLIKGLYSSTTNSKREI